MGQHVPAGRSLSTHFLKPVNGPLVVEASVVSTGETMSVAHASAFAGTTQVISAQAVFGTPGRCMPPTRVRAADADRCHPAGRGRRLSRPTGLRADFHANGDTPGDEGTSLFGSAEPGAVSVDQADRTGARQHRSRPDPG
ncbi:MAG: hypothetical protein GEU86_12420 [Actinophytocola sp.]|nr:hypothetical protein [Actinophytocola sp.]